MGPVIRLPLKNAYNVRDLGGYACSDGGMTCWRRIIRGDDLPSLDAGDIQFLLDYGVRTVIDLRSPLECEEHPDPFRSISEVHYVYQPLGQDVVDDVNRVVADYPGMALERFYRSILENCGDSLRVIFETIARAQEGAVLFHCKIGKDRTGVVAALLLAAVGVSTEDIIANYMVSFEYLQRSPFFHDALKQYSPELLYSPAKTMRALMAIIEREYGGVETYLGTIHVTGPVLGAIRRRFCGG